jgi:hypothetical protein
MSKEGSISGSVSRDIRRREAAAAAAAAKSEGGNTLRNASMEALTQKEH